MSHHALGPALNTIASGRNLGRRLTRAALESAALALLVAGLAINLALYAWSHADLQNAARMQAQIAADGSGAALLFGDAKAAAETLATLKAVPEIVRVDLLDAAGRRFSTYERAAQSSTPWSALLAGAMLAEAPVVQNGAPIGRIAIEVSLVPLRTRVAQLAALTLGAALFALAASYLRVRRVRRAVVRTEAHRDRLALFDSVTGLYNRHAATEHLRHLVERAQPGHPGFALLLMDLDDFKLVNDTLGHIAGDEVLTILGERLRSGLGSAAPVFRLGGDEFVVVSEQHADDAGLQAFGRAALTCLRDPLLVAGHEMFVRGSVGVARYPEHASTAAQLLRAADTAMYQAKSAGKNTFAVFNAAMSQDDLSRLELHTQLRHALERDELVLHYQPIVDLRTGAVLGMEALVRWQHPARGLLAPAAFIEIAERSGLISDLGGWVLHAAARQQADWERTGLGHLFIAVNASGRQFRSGLLLEQVRKALEASGANPERLQIEITEHTLVDDVASNVQTLMSLRRLGLRIAIDDFGTGLSSLAYLKRLPIDKLKIDRSFVRDLPASGEDSAIVAAILSMAAALGLEVVAEGIETAAQWQLLLRLGSAHGQGYLFSKPVPAERVTCVLDAVARMRRQQGAASSS